MVFEDVKEVYDRYESVLSNLKAQFLKFAEEREKRQKKILIEINEIGNEDLPMSIHISNFLEWDSTALLLEEQRVKTHEEYVKSLYKVLKDIKSQGERITELTEELEMKEEDLNLMAEKIREKEDSRKKLELDNQKLIVSIRKIRMDGALEDVQKPIQRKEVPMVPSVGDNPTAALFTESQEFQKPTKKKIFCEICGKEVLRATNAKYCIECAILRRSAVERKSRMGNRKRGRPPKTETQYDTKGDEIPEEVDATKEEQSTEDVPQNGEEKQVEYDEFGREETGNDDKKQE